MPLSGIVFLALTAILSLLWSRSSLLAWDEYLSLWTDRLPSLAQIVHVQRNYPISLDPLFYHMVAHAAIRVFGAGPFAMRLPSLIGFLMMQVCLFFFVRRIATKMQPFLRWRFQPLLLRFSFRSTAVPMA